MASLRAVEHWDREVDVLIVGAGLAGYTTAIAAKQADPDCSVLLIDKLGEGHYGGASRCAAQYLNCPEPGEAGQLMDYQRKLNEPFSIPESLLETWATAVCTNRPWIAELAANVGLELFVALEQDGDFPHFPGAEVVRKVWSIGQPGCSGVWKTFSGNAEQLGVETLIECPAHDLVQDPDTLEVHGVLATHGGRTIAIRARRGVALTLGGMAANLKMLQEYRGYDAMYSMGTPANQGDGFRMLQKAGADMWHVTTHAGGIAPGIKVPEYPSAFMRSHITQSAFIDVAADSRRFYDETFDYEATHFKELRHGHWRDVQYVEVQPVHMIMDSSLFDHQQLGIDWVGWNAVALGYRWSADNRTELDQGWIVQADTIGELAAKLGREPAALEATIAEYNAHCAAGADPEFGRSPERLQALDQGPFYAIQIVPCIPGTTGGGRRDEQSRVISTAGTPIPRLYEAGELGSTLCNLYQNGSLLTEGIAFGRIAGANLAAEVPRPSVLAV
jgi:succinate dehydrogenase/fumarate reductase flavoprotein subunit